MQCNIEEIKREAALDALSELPYHLALHTPPLGLKGAEALNCVGAGGRFKDRVRLRRKLVPPQPARLLKGQSSLRRRIGCEEVTIAKRALQSTDFLHYTALLPGLRQFLSQRGRQPTTAITHH